jgi:hypothetical protein
MSEEIREELSRLRRELSATKALIEQLYVLTFSRSQNGLVAFGRVSETLKAQAEIANFPALDPAFSDYVEELGAMLDRIEQGLKDHRGSEA